MPCAEALSGRDRVQSCPCYCSLSLSNVFNYLLTRGCAYAAELRLVIFLAVAVPCGGPTYRAETCCCKLL